MSSEIDIGPLNTANVLDIGPLQTAPSGGGGTPLNYTFSDQLVLSDSIIINSLPFADTLTLSDSITVVAPIFLSINEDYSSLWQDAAAYVVGIPLNILEFPLALADSISVVPNAVISLNLSDQLTLSDSFLEFTSNPLTFSDQLVLQDSIQLSSIISNIVFSDQLSFSDSVQLLLAPLANLVFTESLSLSDAVTVTVNSIFTSINLSFTDSLALMDSQSLLNEPFLMNFSDSFMFEDSIIVSLETDLNPYLRRYLNDVIGQSNP